MVRGGKPLGSERAEAPPALPVSVDRTGERLRVQGRECERVVLKSTREVVVVAGRGAPQAQAAPSRFAMTFDLCFARDVPAVAEAQADRKSTRLNSSHSQISYAVFCLK